MRTLTMREHVRGTHPAEYRERELSATRLADVRRAITRGRDLFNGGRCGAAAIYFEWVTDALRERAGGCAR